MSPAATAIPATPGIQAPAATAPTAVATRTTRQGVATRSWRALGTSVHVLVTRERDIADASAAVASVLERVDAAYSRFRPDSELNRLNATPGHEIRVSPLLGGAIELALSFARRTDGAVDPTVGRAMRAIGYDADFGLIAADSRPIVLRVEPIPGWRTVQLDPRSRTVRLALGVELDLGSIGKGLAADLAAAAAHRAMGGGGVLVSLGGDLATAGVPPEGGWRVLAAEDSETPPDAPGEVIAIRDGALATSSTTVRRWTRGGIALHHIVDPITGLPVVSPWRTATVAAASCVEANAAATAAIVKGDQGRSWLESTGLPARLVGRHGGVRHVGAWPRHMEIPE